MGIIIPLLISILTTLPLITTNNNCTKYKDLNTLTSQSEHYYYQNGGYSRTHFAQTLLDCELRQYECVRIQIIRNQVYAVQPIAKAYNSRTLATILLMQSLLDRTDQPIPNVDFILYVGDYHHSNLHYWSYSKPVNVHHGWVVPEYSLYAWPEAGLISWTQSVQVLNKITTLFPYESKNATLIWRGSNLIKRRNDMLNAIKKFTLKYWFDIAAPTSQTDSKPSTNERISFFKQCTKYKYLLYVEGYAQSGRFKYQLQCNSLTVAHKIEYLEYWTPMFRPGVHYLEIPNDTWANLPDLMNRVHLADRVSKSTLALPLSPKEMVLNALALSKLVFSHEAMSCHLIASLKAYKRSLTYTQFPTSDELPRHAVSSKQLVRKVLLWWIQECKGRIHRRH